MKLLPVKLPPGVVRPGTDGFARGRWWDTNLIRWVGGSLTPIGGWQRVTSAPLASPPRRIWCWRTLEDIRVIGVMCDAKIYTAEGGGGFVDRTPLDFVADAGITGTAGFGIGPYSDGTYGTPRVAGDPRLFRRPAAWSMDSFGEDCLMVASSDGRLLLLKPSALPLAAGPRSFPDQATVVPGAPTNNRAMVVTEERHVMLFGAGGEPRRIAWCDREDYLNWDFADLTNSAGFFDLDTPGWIVHAAKVKGGVLIFTDSEVWIARYRGQPSIYGFERVGRNCSLLAPHAFASASGTAFWQGQEGFWYFDGGTARPLPSEVTGFLDSDMNFDVSSVRAHATLNGLFAECWFFYASKTPGLKECDRYVVFNFDERWWANGKLSRSAGLSAGVYPYPILGRADGTMYQHEDGWTDAGTTRVGQVYAESAAFSVGSGERTMHILGAQMDSGFGYAATQFRAYSRDTRDGVEAEDGPYAPRSDGWTDCRFSGRDIRLRIENAADDDWGVGEMRFDARAGGQR